MREDRLPGSRERPLRNPVVLGALGSILPGAPQDVAGSGGVAEQGSGVGWVSPLRRHFRLGNLSPTAYEEQLMTQTEVSG